MVVQITPQIGHAMKVQVMREKTTWNQIKDLADANRRIDQLQAALDRATRESADKDAEIERLTERLASGENSGEQPSRSGSQLILANRPVITPSEAARRAGVSVATVSRYLHTGWWQGEKSSNGRWFIFDDLPLNSKRG